MFRNLSLVALCTFAPLSALALPPDADRDWPAWRGPHGTGVAPHGNPPTEWSAARNIRWKVEIPGRGHATPVVWQDRIYIQTAVPAGPAAKPAEENDGDRPDERRADPFAPAWQDRSNPRERPGQDRPPGEGRPRGQRRGRNERPTQAHEFTVLALDRRSGETVWKTVVHTGVPHEGGHETGSQASGSPVTDGERIFAFFGSHGLYCLNRDGRVAWHVDLGDMRTRNEFGEGASPALSGDTVVVQWDHEGDDFLVAFDARTGQERWRTPRDEPTTWATPLIVEVGGKRQVICNGTGAIRSYDLETGTEIWSCGGMTQNPIPTPLHGDGVAYIMSGFRGAAARAIRLADARGRVDDSPAVIWSYDKNTPYVPSPLLYGDRLYFLENNRGLLTCLQARTGEKLYGPERLPDVRNVYASIVGAGGHVYIASRDGATVVLKDGPTFEVVATNTLDDEFNASPVVVGEELFLRGRQHLYCIAEK